MMIEIKSPEITVKDPGQFTIFLGGSIEMGKAEHWQKRLANDLSDVDNITLFNPRRDDWDSSWIQDPTPGTQFHEQVMWELKHQERCDMIVYYFDPGTISPITLLELGAFSYKNVIVCCPKEYSRYGNVKILCNERYIEFVETYDELVKHIRNSVQGSDVGNKILSCPMQDNNAEANTINQYLIALADSVWEQDESFSGKRPFGNSGWKYEIYEALARNGFIKCTLYDEGDIDDIDTAEGDKLISLAIETLYENCNLK